MNSVTCSTILDELEMTARRCGERIAVADENRQFTWQQLWQGSYTLAAQLCETLTPGTPVVVIVLVVSLLSCVQLFATPMDCSLPGSSIHGISQARIPEWVAISSPRDLPDPGIKPKSPVWQMGS